MENKTKTSNIFIWILLFIITVLVIAFIYKDDIVPPSNDPRDQIRKDSLELLKRQIDSSHVRQEKLQHDIDSLSSLDLIIIYRTHEKIKFINTTATPSQLDSIIRATWDNGHN